MGIVRASYATLCLEIPKNMPFHVWKYKGYVILLLAAVLAIAYISKLKITHRQHRQGHYTLPGIHSVPAVLLVIYLCNKKEIDWHLLLS